MSFGYSLSLVTECYLTESSTAALRELHEETGYGDGKGGKEAEVEDVSSVLVKDPG